MAQYIDIHTHNPRPDIPSPTMSGIHPWEAEREVTLPDLSLCDIIGETGLDYACTVEREAQKSLFEWHLTEAARWHKPVVRHCVKALEDVMPLLRKHKIQRAVFHGFIGSTQQAERAIAEGYALSFGERSLQSPRTRQVIVAAPLENMFLETDDRADIAIEEIYHKVAAIRGVSVEELQVAIEKNYELLFR